MSRRPLGVALCSALTRPATMAIAALAALVSVLPATAFQVRQRPSRFDPLVIHDPSVKAGAATMTADRLPSGSALRSAWQEFLAIEGPAWEVYLDGRSGAPMLVQGPGIPWIPGSGNTLAGASRAPAPPVTIDTLEPSLRQFIADHRAHLLAADAELTLDREASGRMMDETWQVVFARTVEGVPVPGDRYVFIIGHGNLIAFGAPRWSRITAKPVPTLSAFEAFDRLKEYMQLGPIDSIKVIDSGSLRFLPLAASATELSPYAGVVGEGYRSALVWGFVLTVAGEPGTWVGQVDAHTGAILALFDDDKYAQVRGGVYPTSNDSICPDGCEQQNYPMPFADLSINGNVSTANAMGKFACTPAGGTATTTLAGPYVQANDVCGPVSLSVTCEGNLDFRFSSGTDCAVPAGASPGDTHATRTGFYHLNRIVEKGRFWLPTRPWLTSQLSNNVNINDVCNAFWDGFSVNFFKSGGGCRNTGEIAGVFLHEWGHGLDQNDGGGFDNPSESYADVASIFQTHASCMGRGFFSTGRCGGYGNQCLTCTGIRELDWNARQAHNPATPANFVMGACGGGSAPCGREVHCEGYIAGEAIWDLAARDLPAMGLDTATAWQVAERLWYRSRLGSGGNMYNCSLPNSDGCNVSAWFSKLRIVDDDDGNLNNGTPHGAAIFAAFNRHAIACGGAGDAANQNFSTCPSLAATTLSVSAGIESASLSWTAVPGAASYRVLRNDAGCSSGYTVVATVAGTNYTDMGLANGATEYYAIQPIGSNSACEGVVSNCAFVTPQAFLGPHATYLSHASLVDACGSAGIGANNGVWDSGERVQFQVQIYDDGTVGLTDVTATVTPLTPGVTMIDPQASFANVSSGASSSSQGPHFTAQLPAGLACGSTVSFEITVSSAEGSWSSAFSQKIGLSFSGQAAALDVDFAQGIPPPWTIVDGGTAGGAASTWTTANPGNRLFTSPIVGPVAMVDSAAAGFASTQDEQMITPLLNLTGTSSVVLDFDHYFRWFNGGFDERAEVDVRSSLTGGVWVNLLSQHGSSTTNPRHETINITAQAAGAADVQVRFHYYQAYFEWWWEVDNVRVIINGNGCNTTACAPLASPPPPVPDGVVGTSMTAIKGDAFGSFMDLDWDAASCPAPGYHILYGNLGAVSTYGLSGAVCTIGASGAYTWYGVPFGDLWFVIASDSGGTEGTWGKDGAGADRNAENASGKCGLLIRDNGGSCATP